MTILIDTSEAARMLGMSKQSLERWRRNNIGPAFHKIGGAVRYDRDDLFSYLKTHRVGAGEDVAHRPSSRDLCSLSFAAKELNLDEGVLLEIIERNLAPDAARPTLVEEGDRQDYFYERHALGELSYWMLVGGAECEMAAIKEIILRHDQDHGYYELFGRQPPDLFNRSVVVASE